MSMPTDSDRSPVAAPSVVAHRGASSAFPENTLAAFRGAAALGADWIELDVRRTADRHLVVHHDPAAPDSVTPIVDRARAELPSSICSLADALCACSASEPALGVNIEIKSDRGEPDHDPTYWVCGAVVEIARELPRTGVLITSFDAGAIDRVRELDPTMPTGLLTLQADADAVRLVAAAGHAAL